MPRRRLFFHADARDQLDLQIQIRPERRNRIKVLVLAGIGGTVDGHLELAEELLSAAKTQLERHALSCLSRVVCACGADSNRVAIQEKPAR